MLRTPVMKHPVSELLDGVRFKGPALPISVLPLAARPRNLYEGKPGVCPWILEGAFCSL